MISIASIILTENNRLPPLTISELSSCMEHHLILWNHFFLSFYFLPIVLVKLNYNRCKMKRLYISSMINTFNEIVMNLMLKDRFFLKTLALEWCSVMSYLVLKWLPCRTPILRYDMVCTGRQFLSGIRKYGVRHE